MEHRAVEIRARLFYEPSSQMPVRTLAPTVNLQRKTVGVARSVCHDFNEGTRLNVACAVTCKRYAMQRAADRNYHPVSERDGQRHITETIADPIEMAAQKNTGFIGIALHGDSNDNGALGAADAQCHAAGTRVAAHFDGSVHAIKSGIRS